LSSSSTASSSSSWYTAKKPGKTIVWPVARKVFPGPPTERSTATVSNFAGVIWQESARFQIIS